MANLKFSGAPILPSTLHPVALEIIEQLAYWSGKKWIVFDRDTDRVTIGGNRKTDMLTVGEQVKRFCDRHGFLFNNIRFRGVDRSITLVLTPMKDAA